MAVSPSLDTIGSGYNLAKINSNFTKVAAAFQDVVSLSGVLPNAMNADFDMNGNDVLNGGVGNFHSLFVNGTDVHNIVGPAGPTGGTGPAGANGNSFTWRGTYSGVSTYSIRDVVQDQNSSWIALGTTTGNAPPTLPTSVNSFWQLMAAKGIDGTNGSGSGTVTTFGFTNANGFSGSVSNATSTPNLTLTTSVTGVLKGNGTSIAAATGGTDYLVPGGALGTPSSGTLTNTTGLPIAGITGLATGIATFLATPSSANLATALTDENGTGAVVFTSSPTLTGVPAAPTASLGTNTTQIATTAFVLANGGQLPDTDRRNALLRGCNIAKALVGYQRDIETFYDGYKASDGVASVTNGAVNTTSGYVGPTTTAGTLISQATGTSIGNLTGNGGLASAFDSNTNQAFTSSATLAALNGYVGKNYSGTPKKIGSVKIYGSNNNGLGGTVTSDTTTVTIYGKNGVAPSSGTDGTAISAVDSFSNSASVIRTITSTDQSTSWDYVWVYVTNSTGGFTCVTELEFYLPATTNNMTLVTTSQTADGTVSNGRVLLEIDPIDSITLNTDLTAEVTCNGGTNWATGTLSSIGKGQAGRTIVEIADTTCTSGTSFAARIKTLNNKNVNVYKTAVVVH